MSHSDGVFSSRPGGAAAAGAGGAALRRSRAAGSSGFRVRRDAGVRRRDGARLAALEDASADLHARVARRVQEKGHAFLHDRVRGREGFAERRAEMRRRRRLEVDGEHRRVALAQKLGEGLRPARAPMRLREAPQPLGRTAIVLDETKESQRMRRAGCRRRRRSGSAHCGRCARERPRRRDRAGTS